MHTPDCLHASCLVKVDEVPTGRRREHHHETDNDGAARDAVAKSGGGGGGGDAGESTTSAEGKSSGEPGEAGVDATLGRVGERTVDVVAKLRNSDRFKNQMVSRIVGW